MALKLGDGNVEANSYSAVREREASGSAYGFRRRLAPRASLLRQAADTERRGGRIE